MSDSHSQPSADLSSMMKVYETASVPDNLENPAAITHLRLFDYSIYTYLDEYTYNSYPFRQFETFALLPKLTHISMDGVGGGFIDDSGQYMDIPQRACGVTHMIFTRCQLHTSCLVNLIGFSDNCLEAFTYCTGGLKSEDGCRLLIAPGNVFAALYESSATLKLLDVDFDDQAEGQPYWEFNDDDEEDEDEDEDEDDGDANQDDEEDIEDSEEEEEQDWVECPFPNLTILRIGVESLMKLMVPSDGTLRLIDALPKGLEELMIRGYDTEVVNPGWKAHIDEVKEKMAEKLPNLKMLQGIEEIIPNGRDSDEKGLRRIRR